MSQDHDYWVYDDLPEPGVLSGIFTLVGGLFGGFLVVYSYLYGGADGPIATAHIALVIGFGLVFTFLVAAFTFLIGWAIELAWPVLLLMIFVGLLLLVPLYFYFGVDTLMNSFNQAVMFG